MKAMVLMGRGAETLRLVERPMPEPAPNEIVVRIRAAALNYRDHEIISGTFSRQYPLPLVPLSDGAGEVVATGRDVRRFAVGDRVCSTFWQGWTGGGSELADPARQLGGAMPGVLSEYIALDENGAVATPAHLSDEEACTLPCAAVTAWHALVTEGALKAGDDILIQGTGGVSMFALQFAVMSGARAVVLSSSDAKLERARELGAAITINYRKTPEWSGAVLDATAGRGVDHVLEVGGAQTFVQSLNAVRVSGRISVIGYLGGKGGEIDPLAIFRKRAVVTGISVGSRSSFEAMNRAIAHHHSRPVIDQVFALADFGQALERLAAGRHFGKIVVRL